MPERENDSYSESLPNYLDRYADLQRAIIGKFMTNEEIGYVYSLFNAMSGTVSTDWEEETLTFEEGLQDPASLPAKYIDLETAIEQTAEFIFGDIIVISLRGRYKLTNLTRDRLTISSTTQDNFGNVSFNVLNQIRDNVTNTIRITKFVAPLDGTIGYQGGFRVEPNITDYHVAAEAINRITDILEVMEEIAQLGPDEAAARLDQSRP